MVSCDVINCGGRWIEVGLRKLVDKFLLRIIILIGMGVGKRDIVSEGEINIW